MTGTTDTWQGVRAHAARGKEARAAVPRSSHGGWRPPPDRRDPVDWLEEQARDRVPALVPIRYGRMLVSPFTFFRGAALIMAADLATTPDTGLVVQACGDAHLSNFGVFGTAERRMLFDINDFDETHPAPWEWDVKRLAASLEVAGRDRGFSASDRRDIVSASVREYRESMQRAARMGVLEAWYAHMSVEELRAWLRTEVKIDKSVRREQQTTERLLEKARTRDSARVVTRLAEEADGELRFAANPPLIVPLQDLTLGGLTRDQIREWMTSLVGEYRRSLAQRHHPVEDYRFVDVARKVVGVGSVGTRAWILLFLGRDAADPLVLQAKEAQASVLERFTRRSRYRNYGQRVVVGQQLMQAASDLFLGWLRLEGLDGQRRDYYVRQLHDWKGSADVEDFRVQSALLYGRLCGSTLARAHARSGDRVAIAAYLGRGATFDRALASFASDYADQNERDYAKFAAAVRCGRIEAQTGL